MRQQSKEYIVILFIVSLVALNYPFLDLMDTTWMPFGIPLLYLYLYIFWFLVIVLLIAIVSRSEIRESDRFPTVQRQPHPPSKAAAVHSSGSSENEPENRD